jgi:hypothetical protein
VKKNYELRPWWIAGFAYGKAGELKLGPRKTLIYRNLVRELTSDNLSYVNKRVFLNMVFLKK